MFLYKFTLLLFIVYQVESQLAAVPKVNVRLVGGVNPSEGRLEVFYQSQWGTVCDDHFGVDDARVVCWMLGYTREAYAKLSAFYGQGADQIWLTNLQCSGDEESVSECMHSGWSNTKSCGHSEDVGVQCIGRLRLTKEPPSATPSNPTLPSSAHRTTSLCQNPPQPETLRLSELPESNQSPGFTGIVEIMRNGRWGASCVDEWNTTTALVFCRSMCFDTHQVRAFSVSRPISTPLLQGTIRCFGGESHINQCTGFQSFTSQCTASAYAAAVTCSSQPRSVPTGGIGNLMVAWTCPAERFSLTVKRDWIETLTAADLRIPSARVGCGADIQQNATHIYVSIPIIGCGTSRSGNASHISYHNNVEISKAKQPGLIITRTPTIVIPLSCYKDRRGVLHAVYEPIFSFTPPGPPPSTPFQFKFVLCAQNVSLGASLCGQMQLLANDALELAVDTLYATPDPNSASNLRYDLYRSGCAQDSTLTKRYLDTKTFNFTFQTFKFFPDYPQVWLHTDLFVCEGEDINLACVNRINNNCQLGRRRRDLKALDERRMTSSESSDSPRRVHVVQGPVYFYEADSLTEQVRRLREDMTASATGSIISKTLIALSIFTTLA